MSRHTFAPSLPFSAIFVDDTSRLSRTTEDILTIFKRLNFGGVQLIAVSQGISSDHQEAETLITVHGLVDSLYVRETAKKIHRGMEGLALRGLHTGGRIFGSRISANPTGILGAFDFRVKFLGIPIQLSLWDHSRPYPQLVYI
jgi:DNA invertase Pin-like site-specific DNA recombinase